jgi:hypothetical protein
MHPLHSSKDSLQLPCTPFWSHGQQALLLSNPCILLIVNLFLTFVVYKPMHSNLVDGVKFFLISQLLPH